MEPIEPGKFVSPLGAIIAGLTAGVLVGASAAALTSLFGQPPNEVLSVGMAIGIATAILWGVSIHGQPIEQAAPSALPVAASDEFLWTDEWIRLRYQVLAERGGRCECCGRTAADGVRINVDHIKPRKHFPELALDPDNLQILCADCNKGKGNRDQTDWRGRGQPARRNNAASADFTKGPA